MNVFHKRLRFYCDTLFPLPEMFFEEGKRASSPSLCICIYIYIAGDACFLAYLPGPKAGGNVPHANCVSVGGRDGLAGREGKKKKLKIKNPQQQTKARKKAGSADGGSAPFAVLEGFCVAPETKRWKGVKMKATTRPV
jgi:hypothetical protein